MFIDNRVVQAEAGDVEAARELIIDLAYSLSHKEPLSEAVTAYFIPRLLKIAEGADATKILNLIFPEGRPHISPNEANLIVNLVIDKMKEGVPKTRAYSELERDGACPYITKKGKKESLSAKQIGRIFDIWAPRIYPQATLDHLSKKK